MYHFEIQILVSISGIVLWRSCSFFCLGVTFICVLVWCWLLNTVELPRVWTHCTFLPSDGQTIFLHYASASHTLASSVPISLCNLGESLWQTQS